RPVGAGQVEVAVAVEVGDLHAVRSGSGEHLLRPGRPRAGVPVDLDLVRIAPLVHLGGGDVEVAVAVEVAGTEEVMDALDRVVDRMLVPGLLGIGRGLEPGDPVAAAGALGGREHDVHAPVAVDVPRGDEGRVPGPGGRV